MVEAEWYNDRSKLAEFAEVLHESAQIEDVDDMLYFLHKPWIYSAERKAWETMGMPMPDSSKWDDYMDSLDESDE